MTAAPFSWTQVVAVAKELADPAIDPVAQQMIIPHVMSELDPALFGGEGHPKLTYMRALLAAHYAAGEAVGVGGAVSAERAGALSRSYQQIDLARPYQETSYGRLFYQLLRSSPARIGFAL